MTALTARDAATTTGTNINASRVSIFPDVVDDDGDIAFDFMDTAIITAIHRLPVRSAVTWRKGISLPALSEDSYGTSSWYWIFLIYNGFITSSTIPNGATINIPDITSLRVSLQVNRRGTVVTI